MTDISTARTPATSARSSAIDVLKPKQAKAALAAAKRYDAELGNAKRILSEEEFSRVEKWLSVHKLKTSYSMLLIRTSLLVDIYTEKLEREGNSPEVLEGACEGDNSGGESDEPEVGAVLRNPEKE